MGINNSDNHNWKNTKLGNILTLEYGKGLTKKERKKGRVPVYGSSGIVGYHNEKLANRPGVIVGRKGVVGSVFYTNKDFFPIDTTYYVKSKLNKKYLYYLLKSLSFKRFDSSSAVPGLNRHDAYSVLISVPEDKQERKAIVNVLSSLDDKIELNKKTNKTLEEIGKAIFKRWFVDFEFPHDEGIAYKSDGGEMVDSEIGEIPKGWEVKKLGDFFPVKTGKKNANIATDNGNYPFFTCSQDTLATDDYSFDTQAILLAGNGDFNVKWYRGKFEVYQRTYILEPYQANHLGWLYFLVETFLKKITLGHRGSVIKYLTKGMIQDFQVVAPETEKLKELVVIFSKLIDLIEYRKKETKRLVKIRDLLLPRLMTGRIRI